MLILILFTLYKTAEWKQGLALQTKKWDKDHRKFMEKVEQKQDSYLKH